jgi:hypothetical protein
MKRAHLENVDPSARTSFEHAVTRIEMAQTLGQSLVHHQAETERLTSEMYRLGVQWRAPEGFLWAITSSTNSFGIVVPSRKSRFLRAEGFAPPSDMREFSPPKPFTNKEKYVFLADSIIVAGPSNETPGAAYADGSFADERLNLDGDHYEIGCAAVADLPDLIANHPLSENPNLATHRSYGIVSGLTIEPRQA